VTPLSLGVETLGGATTVLIPRNTTIPTKKSETFSTATDNQTQVDVHVLQGERPLARDNRTLGRFQLVGIAPAQRGQPQIGVTFDIDANGILNVSAKDMASGKEQQITITASSGLSKADVDRMIREAESNAADDARRRQEIELRNQTDSMLYQTERALAEHGARLDSSERAAVEQALNEAREAIRSEDAERIRRAQEALTRASQKLAEVAYRQSTGAGGPGGTNGSAAGGGGQPGQDDVVDAEFRDVDGRKA
jgi:molecular chaperone DnaK